MGCFVCSVLISCIVCLLFLLVVVCLSFGNSVRSMCMCVSMCVVVCVCWFVSWCLYMCKCMCVLRVRLHQVPGLPTLVQTDSAMTYLVRYVFACLGL